MNSKLIPSISLNVIGTYRAQLMGIAMLNVMMLHSLSWLSLNLPKSVVFVMGLLFTEGFLFLSGFGLYYSFYKNSNLKQFYGKRVQRLLIPYWIITTPFFVVQVTNGDYGYFGFIQRFFTIAFWTHGNYAGLWYISVSVLLYLCFPLIFRGLQKRYIGGGHYYTVTNSYFCNILYLSRVLSKDQYWNCQTALFRYGRLGGEIVN